MTAFDNAAVMAVAKRQSAIDLGCDPGDFDRDGPVVVESRADPRARRYLRLPFACDLVSYGSNVVASVDARHRGLVAGYLDGREPFRCFETPAIHRLDDALRPHGLRVCFQAEYFLPDPDRMTAAPCRYGTAVLGPDDFAGLYVDAWSNALCAERPELDVLGVGAYDRGELIGLAACSADCEDMWQIGVDVLPAYRRQGVASALTGMLAAAILERGKVPFYCCAWSNIPSARNAIACGFRPAWAELTLRPEAECRF
ncbi:GNAT family N-acetyltransferase [Bifidobacterium phasiani]|uniref:GNAT family N-acetyltransferase n=1 Tax=Bifidobacterium phasiani TaxID=2834431 RepID=A0ABS6W883_9BIFI|nr:GNAT family N-acetyltransferase [Bifidobacterium phasiani]MBW3082701.1 GNAT family N-acetyltransferase [Bifidobacterium phasiani]